MLRLFDLICSIIGLVIAFPVLICIFMLGFLETGSPLFVQKRLGQNQKTFTLVKFRTMHKGTKSVLTHLANQNSVTVFGRFLRSTKLDELPQLWNVLRGEMSIVGPRPGLENDKQLIKARQKLNVYNVRPGITGLAQINGIDMSDPDLLAQTDARMILNMSVKDYMKYIILTIIGYGRGDKIHKISSNEKE